MTAIRRFDAVFFDLGHTLLGLKPFDEWVARTCAEHALTLSAEEVAGLHAGVEREIAAFRLASGVSLYAASVEQARRFWFSLFRRILDASGRAYPADLPTALYERFTRSDSVHVYPDVVPTLTALRTAGIRLGVISDWEAWCEPMLDYLELAHLFDFAVISGVLGTEKPSPCLFRLALERAGVPAGRAVHVGDDPALDCHAAHTVGITPVLLDRHGRHPDSMWLRMEDLSSFADWVLSGDSGEAGPRLRQGGKLPRGTARGTGV